MIHALDMNMIMLPWILCKTKPEAVASKAPPSESGMYQAMSCIGVTPIMFLVLKVMRQSYEGEEMEGETYYKAVYSK
jgi:hypothetical protein